MRFKDFLLETYPGDFNMEQFLDDCAPYIEAIKGSRAFDLLKHGTKSGPDVWGIRKHEKRIGPRDSDPRLHDAVNDFFVSEFGWDARTDALFASSSWIAPKAYGLIYFVFPVGKFQFLWSPKIEDLWSDVHLLRSAIMKKHKDMSRDEAMTQAIHDGIELVKNGKWKFNTDLRDAMQMGNEVMLKSLSGKYYLIRTSTDFVVEFVKELHRRDILTSEHI